ncbi:hypothetical protein [Novipirellula rosea]|uniref:hypothetical protein n=1 Tax=Novipirellula rosea TaxID=1031540 RepID=UPI0031E5E779
MNLASRIALIAYVVGGWLLPAMHHHPGHSHTQLGGAAGSTCCSDHGCDAALATPDSSHGDGSHADDGSQCCHHHDRCDVAPTSHSAPSAALTHSPADQSHSVLYAVDSGDPHACIGLCALCAAQSLIGQTVANSSSSIGEITLVDRIGSTGIGWPLRVQRGGISSRGPPAIL